MSSFVKPWTFANQTEFRSDHYNENEEALKNWSNQEIVDTDIQDESLSGTNLQQGSLNIIRNTYSFQTGLVGGQNQKDEVPNHSFITSTTKNNSPTTAVQFQDIAGSGVTFTLKDVAEVIYHTYVHIHTYDNVVVAGNEGAGNGMWETSIQMRLYYENGNAVNKPQTIGYGFEGVGSPLDAHDPVYSQEAASYRSVMATYSQTLSPGTYTICLTTDTHAETSNLICKGTMVEAFYL
jgi:hypothetical protein